MAPGSSLGSYPEPAWHSHHANLPYLYQAFQPYASTSALTLSSLAADPASEQVTHWHLWLSFLPAGVVLIRGALHLASRAGRNHSSRSRAKQPAPSPQPRSRLLRAAAFFAPFVTQRDIEEHHKHTNHVHSAAVAVDQSNLSADAKSHLLASSPREGFRRQRRRVAKLFAVASLQTVAYLFRIGWDIGDALSPLSDLSPALAWSSLALSLALAPPHTPTLSASFILAALSVSCLSALLSAIPTLAPVLHGSSLTSALSVPLVLTLFEGLSVAYAVSLLLAMPLAPGGYEANVSIDEQLRSQNLVSTGQEQSNEARPLAETYHLCPTSPEDYCSLGESISYSWMAPIQRLALQRSLTPTDVWRLRSINDTRILFSRFQKTAPRSSLLARIVRANANDILLDAMFKLIAVSFAYLGTFIMKSILSEIQIAAANPDLKVPDGSWSPRQKALVYAIIGLFLTVLRFLAELQNFHHARQVGLRIRSTLVVSLFEKALKRRDLSGLTHPGSPKSDSDQDRTQQNASADEGTPLTGVTTSSPSIHEDSNSSFPDPDVSDSSIEQEPHTSQSSPRPDQHGHDDQETPLKRHKSWTSTLAATVRKRISINSIWRRSLADKQRQQQEPQRKVEQERQEAEDRRGADIGKVVNMMASDINVLLRMGCDLHQLYGAPFEVAIATFFLYQLMGWSALVGFSILVAAIPVNYFWGESAVKMQRQYSAARDRRMNLMTELIDAIRFVKIQGMERRWEERVTHARRHEIRRLIWSRVMSFLFELLWTSVPVLVTLISFFFYVKVAKNELTVAVAFTAIALFTMIRPPLNAIPGFLMGGFIALVSVKRLEAFLTEEEVEQAVSALSRGYKSPVPSTEAYSDNASNIRSQRNNEDLTDEDELSISNGTFCWHQSTHEDSPDSSRFALREISVSFPPQALSIIAGPTGSGKSSLLAALLGEMLDTSDVPSVRRSKFDSEGRSRMSFAAQLPWLEAGKTVRDNITFVTPYDPERYRLCVHACALQDDLDTMEDGDLTRIGAHTVSGGQKARISLARALYARTETVLLDDVLSAVDTRVQNHLVQHALTGPIARGRRIVMATHHPKLLQSRASFLVLMRNGRIEAQGSPEQLDRLGIFTRPPVSPSSPEAGDTEFNRAQARDVESSSSSVTLASKDDKPKPDGQNEAGLTVPDVKKNVADQKHDGNTESPGMRTPRLLYQAETRREGAVSWVFYKTYLQASSMRIWILLVIFLILMRASSAFEQFWLKVWGEAYRVTESQADSWRSRLHLPPANDHPGFYLTIYGLTGLSIIVFNSVRSICFYTASIRASQSLFSRLLTNVIGAPLRWFDTNPAGRILNRFGTDMDGIDNLLPQSIMNLASNSFALVAYLVICIAIVPSFLVPTFILAALGPWLVAGFLASSRDMQRIEATSTSPLYGHFQQAMSGIMTIRAFGAERAMLESLLDAVDLYQALWWAVCTMEVWLSFRSQILGGVTVFIVTLLALSGAVSAGSAGLALSSAQLLCQLASYLVYDFKNLATSFNSLERVAEYQTMAQEEASAGLSLPPAGWPSRQGGIEFEDVVLRYAPELPTVLKGVSLTIKPGEKIGVVGRTGSGKSSLASSLFRAAELSGGRILIDGINIASVPLNELRRRLSIVMQDPVLFSGTIRDNLDPFGEYADAELSQALSRVALDQTVSLSTMVSSGGANLSAGQAQLVSLARALVRGSSILILDEATSSTDAATDALIQHTIRHDMHGSTVLCVAHRLRTVMDYSRVLVMHDGHAIELGTPAELLERPGSVFAEMCRQSSEYAALRQAAGLE